MAKPTPARRDTPRSEEPRRWYGRVPWLAIAVSIAVVLSSGYAVSPIVDPATRADVAEAYLVRPLGYVVLAPLSNVLDTLTVLSLNQHIAVVGGVLALFLVWRATLALLRRSSWRGHLVSATTLLVAILVLYAATALLPRPAASLATDNANVLIVDFHSHTDASHDTRQSVADNRAWHARLGFHVGYVTDHYAIAGAERAIATNPRVAGEGTVLLQGIETAWNGEHVTILGAERAFKGLMTPNFRDVDTLALRLGSTIPTREPVVIWNHPRRLDALPVHAGATTPGIRAVEIVNGGPRDIDRVRAHRIELVSLAERSDLALVASSDNHGWGHATPGWTMLRIFNWRAMAPDQLATQIDGVLRGGGFGSTGVVERRVADSRRFVWASAFTVPARMFTTLTTDERIMWLAWTWLVAGALWFWRRRRASV